MRSSTVRGLWIAAAVVLAGLGFWKMGERSLAGLGQPKFFRHTKSPAKDIREIQVARSGEILILKRGEHWELTSPEIYKADSNQAEEAVSALAQAKLEERVSSRPEALGDFDLLGGKAIGLSVKDEKGRVLAAGRLGKVVTGSFERTYFTLEGSSEVHILRLARYHFDRGANDWKDRVIVEIAPSDIVSLDIRKGDARSYLEVKGSSWTVNGKIANQEKARDLVNALSRFEASEFASTSEAADPAKLGLGAKPKELSLSIRRRAGPADTLRIGALKDSMYYAQIAGKPTVWKVSEWRVRSISVKPADLEASPSKSSKTKS